MADLQQLGKSLPTHEAIRHFTGKGRGGIRRRGKLACWQFEKATQQGSSKNHRQSALILHSARRSANSIPRFHYTPTRWRLSDGSDSCHAVLSSLFLHEASKWVDEKNGGGGLAARRVRTLLEGI